MNQPALGQYAADQSGLVYGYVFSADGGHRQIDTAATQAWLGGGEARAGEFIWLHFNGSHAATPNWLQQHVAELPEEFIEALREHGNNKTSTAKSLGITREGLHKKLRSLGL